MYILMKRSKESWIAHSIHSTMEQAVSWGRCLEHDGCDCSICVVEPKIWKLACIDDGWQKSNRKGCDMVYLIYCDGMLRSVSTDGTDSSIQATRLMETESYKQVYVIAVSGNVYEDLNSEDAQDR